jgi:hypothetical protein
LNRFEKGTSIHALYQADCVDTLLAKTVPTGAKEPILFPVVS